MKNEHSIALLCHLLEVSASGFYAWSQRVATPGPRAMEDQALSQEIRQICATSRQTYGSPRVVLELRSHGRHHRRRRVARHMSQQGLYGRQKGRYLVQTTDSNHGSTPSLPIAWQRRLRPRLPIKSRSLISPISKPTKAGSTSLGSSTFTAAKSSAGP